jgi:transcriptional regulator with XRE-family HTH domain
MQNLTIARKIRKAREHKEFTQDYMANKLQIEPTAYGRLERGDTSIKVDQLVAISRILNIEPEYFLSGEDSVIMHNPIQNNTANGTFNGDIITNINEELLKNVITLIQQTNELTKKLIEKL